MALVESSLPIKRQELSKKLRIKEDSKTALRKKKRSFLKDMAENSKKAVSGPYCDFE